MKKLFFLLLTAVCALLYGPPANAWEVYLTGDTWGFTPTAHLWDSSDKALNGAYPGNNMTWDDEAKHWVASGSGTPAGIIFTKGDNGNNSTKLFNGNGTFHDGFTYHWNKTDGEDWPTYTEPAEWKDYTIYVKDNSGQSDLCLYVYGAQGYNPSSLNTFGTNGYKFSSCDKDNDGVYIVNFTLDEYSSDTPKLMFDKGNDWKSDEPAITNKRLYTIGSDNKVTVSSSEYTPVYSTPDPEWTEYTIYVENNSGKSNVCVYLWDVSKSDPAGLTDWGDNSNNLAVSGNLVSGTTNIYRYTFKLEKKSGSTPQMKFKGKVGDTAWEPSSGGVTPTSGHKYVISSDLKITDGGEYTPGGGGDDPVVTPEAGKKYIWFRKTEWGEFKDDTWTTPHVHFVTTGCTPNNEHNAMTNYEGKKWYLAYDGQDNPEIILTDGQWNNYDPNNLSYKHQTVTFKADNSKIYEIREYIQTDGDTDYGKWKVSAVGDAPVLTPKIGPDPAKVPAGTYLWLKESDFFQADGKTPKPHYFIVGTRTADWAMLPEWELKVDGNEATLSGRFMYQGYFAIAKVDNYHDFAYGRYDLYSSTGDITDSRKSVSLTKKLTATGALRYGKKNDADEYWFDFKQQNLDNSMRWMATATDFKPETMTESKPAYLNKVTLTLGSDGAPTAVAFDYDYSTATVAEHTAMTLVGNNIRYVGDYNLGGALGSKNLDSMGRVRSHSGNTNLTGWSNSWIQSDKNGRPYVDARGNTVYLTGFDKEWLADHSTMFYNEDKGLPYSSESVTFLPPTAYADYDKDTYQYLYTAHPGVSTTIGDSSKTITLSEGTETKAKYKERFPNGKDDDDENYGTVTTALSSDDWTCYVVKNMWLQGPFKVWTGTSQNIKAYDGTNSVSDIQWFYENGGHGISGTQKTVNGYDLTSQNGGTIILYPTKRDVNGADFSTPKDSKGNARMKFYSRVVMWYNPTTGFENSVLQFIEPIAEPVIQAFYNNTGDGAMRNTLKYKWWINVPDGDTSHDSKTVSSYKIWRVDASGKETLVESKTINKTVAQLKDEDAATITVDPKQLTPGYYSYRVEAVIAGNPRTNSSNELPINETDVPVELTVAQQMKKVVDGTQEVDNENGDLYTFNVQVDFAAKEDVLNHEIGTTGTTVEDMMKYYVIVVDAATKNALDKATEVVYGSNNTDASDFDWTLSTGSNCQLSSSEYVNEGLWFKRVEINDGKSDYNQIVWHNVDPTATQNGKLKGLMKNGEWVDMTAVTYYSKSGNTVTESGKYDVAPLAFSVYLTTNDNVNDIANWDLLNFDAATGATEIVAPSTKFIVDVPRLQKSQDCPKTHIKDVAHHPDGGRLKNLMGSYVHNDGGVRTEDPVVYEELNESAIHITIDPLAVSDELLENWKFVYTVAVAPSSQKSDEMSMNTKDLAQMTYSDGSLKYDVREGLDMTVYDLDLSSLQTMESFDGHTKYIDGVANKGLDFDGLFLFLIQRKNVAANEGWNSPVYYNADAPSVRNKTLDLGFDKPILEQYPGKWLNKYAANYYDQPDLTVPGTMENYGYYAHGIAGVTITYNKDVDLHPYVAFHAQQHVKYDEEHGGFYSQGRGRDWWGGFDAVNTRPANGGRPVHNGWHSDVTSVVPCLSYTDDEGKKVEYEELPVDIDDEGVRTPTDPDIQHNWSRMAALGGYLPIHINPIYQYEDEDDYKATDGAKNAEIEANVAIVYPVISSFAEGKTSHGAPIIPQRPTVINEIGQSGAPRRAPMSRNITSDPAINEVFMVAAPSSITLDFQGAITTGVEDILGDATDDGEAEYYNLQGMRVSRPAKGQVYIVRRGAKATKVLY